MDWPHAHGLARPAALFRRDPADFRVDEELGFALTGEGEHLWLLVEKTGLNTIDVVNRLSQVSGCRKRDIGYAGLKDRQAVARQWFSLKTGKSLTGEEVDAAGIRLCEQGRNARKCRLGSHRGNRFVITLREVQMGDAVLADATDTLSRQGVPNYFGLQRFGHGGRNLDRATALFRGEAGRLSRFQRGMYLSAARAFLFNEVLAARVRDDSWDGYVPGDVMALAGSRSVFETTAGDPALAERLRAGDIHPTGPLWGRGQPPTGDRVLATEQAVAAAWPILAGGLEEAGLKQERRPLRVLPENLALAPGEGGQLVVEFALPRGAFATSVLRELVTAAGL